MERGPPRFVFPYSVVVISPSRVNELVEWYYQRFCRDDVSPSIPHIFRAAIPPAHTLCRFPCSIHPYQQRHSVSVALVMGQNSSRQQAGGSFSKPPLPPQYAHIFGRSSSEAPVQHRDEHGASILPNEDWRHSETLPSYEPYLTDGDGTSSTAAAAPPLDEEPPRYETLHPEYHTTTHRKRLSRYLGRRFRRGTKQSAVRPPRVLSQRQNTTARPSIPERVSSRNSRSSAGPARPERLCDSRPSTGSQRSEVVQVSLSQIQRAPYTGEDPRCGAAAHRRQFRDLHVQDLQQMREDHALASQLQEDEDYALALQLQEDEEDHRRELEAGS